MIDMNKKIQFSYTSSSIQIDNEVLIGANIKNTISIDFSNTDNKVIQAIDLIDGNRTINDILRELDLDDKSHDDFISIVNIMYEHNVLEYSFSKEQVFDRRVFCRKEYDRFDRQIDLFKHLTGDFDSAINIQETLSKSSIAIIGLGGCGSYIFHTLSAMGIGYISAYEFDVVEESNLSRQMLYNYTDLGKKKIDVAREKSSSISPTTKYKFFGQKIESLEDAKSVFKDVDLVICAADTPRPEFFFILNEAAYLTGKPLLYSGSCANNAVIGPLVIPGQTRCYKCINKVNEIQGEKEYRFVKNIKSAYMTTLIEPYNAVAGSLSALEAIKYLTKFDECQVIENILVIDFSDYNISNESEIFRGHCDICS